MLGPEGLALKLEFAGATPDHGRLERILGSAARNTPASHAFPKDPVIPKILRS